MRLTLLVVIAGLTVLAGCAKKEDQANLPADTTQMTQPAPAPAGVSWADLKGTWKMKTMPVDKDTALVTYTVWIADDTTQWKMKFDNRNDTIAVRVVQVMGESIRTQAGPFPSALRKGVMVVTDADYRLDNGMLVGNVVAHYSKASPDTVLQLRSAGTRAQ